MSCSILWDFSDGSNSLPQNKIPESEGGNEQQEGEEIAMAEKVVFLGEKTCNKI